ncbi:hypothetical protein BJ912DRAFT_977348 [Pholiota molesta]|nr:hypothetical protein BJ912DRAFT_977348 [Pholiota molesta]
MAQWAPLPLRRTMTVWCGWAAQAIRESKGTDMQMAGRMPGASHLPSTRTISAAYAALCGVETRKWNIIICRLRWYHYSYGQLLLELIQSGSRVGFN